MSIVSWMIAAVVAAGSLAGGAQAQTVPARVTVISDAFGKESKLQRSWGYAALVEYAGKRILFDTGGQKKAFVDNAKALKIDLKKLDFVVLSHRHGDHTAGVSHLLQVNPKVKIYAPLETGSFGTPASGPVLLSVKRQIDGVPVDLVYFGKAPPDQLPVDSAWPGANITLIDKPVEVLPGVFLFKTVSDQKGTMELNEVSMAIRTPKGLAVVVGCSHPGIEKILTEASKIDPRIYTVVGGLHLVDKTDAQVVELVNGFQSKWKMEHVAAGHCTGPFAQKELRRVFGEKHDHSGLGEVIALPK